MNEPELSSPFSDATPEPELPPEPEVKKRRPSRVRRFFLRHLPLAVAGGTVLLAAGMVGLFFWASSASFQNFVRGRMVRGLETATGGRVEIGAFHWNLLHLEAEADGVVIHGREAAGEAPYVQVGRIRADLSVLGFWSPRILLRSLDISRPQLHLIVYPDGSTNQPQPRRPRRPGKPLLDRFFDMKAGRVSVQEGVLDYENRAARFDFQNRLIPLDFAANDVSLRMAYMPATASAPEAYQIEAGARDLNLARGAPGNARVADRAGPPVQGFFQASLTLTRSAATLNFLRVTARSRGVKDRSLNISGALDDFAHPRWQARAGGDLDMRLLNSITGFPFAPEGLARLNLFGAGQAGIFRADGSVHVDDGSYIGTGVVARGVGLDAQIHADPEQLRITGIKARLHPGGEIEGDLTLAHWLPTLPGAVTLQPPSAAGGKLHSRRAAIAQKPSTPADETTIPVDGKVTARFNGVALDTLLEMVSERPFQHLGFDTRVNGAATANWVNGDYHTLSVDAQLSLTPPAQAAAGMTPASGRVDATYTQRDGAVAVRTLELHTPASQVEARGHLGAYPLTSLSALSVDFQSRNLGEFDTVLRDLGLRLNGKRGVAALPISFSGQADFHGAWYGSLADPHLSGTAKVTQLTVELPAKSPACAQPAQCASPQVVHLDSVEATGSYSAAHIELASAVLRHGAAEIALGGTLDAMPLKGHAPSFNANSVVHLRLRAGQVGLDDLRPFLAGKLPATGSLDAQLQVDGPMREISGSGWVELDKGSVYGEPVTRLRAEGSMAGQTIHLNSVTVNGDAGKFTASGSYDLRARRFQLTANGAGIDVARIEALSRRGLTAAGKLGFSVQGGGTFDDPRLEIHAKLAGFSLNGEPLGTMEMAAQTANRAVSYDMSTQLATAELHLHGKTALSGDYETQASLDFPRLNVGTVFRLANVQGISGESALAGTVSIEGPLARLPDMRGEARLKQLEVTVAGVHLRSAGDVHATLDHATIHLDPLHVTGEDTDLHAAGSLSLQGKQDLNLAANGAINLKVAETLDPDITSSGDATFQMEAHGPLRSPSLSGQIVFQNGSMALEDLPNGLSQLHGTLEFNQNRLEVKSLTAMTGGGLLSLGGFLAYQHGVFANLTATGTGIRIRYPQGVSSLADANLRLQGPRDNLLLSGNVLITRFAVSSDLDVTALTAQANAIENIAPPDAPSNHVRLDVHIASSPQLNFQNAYAKLAGNVDLHLRGTLASPSLLGRVSITEGSALIAGTRYELQSGEVSFTNPVRIQPNIDLNATARVEDYDITLGLHGTPQNMAVSYHSDPPLPEADVVALLALGRTENQQRLYTQQQEAAGANPTTDALLGGALNATVSSRVQRLFGAGSVKVDPNYLGSLGNSTSRIIVEEQLGRNLTLTYATDVDTTSQQLIQADIAINHHVSLQVARDESGVFSVVLKATRRYR